jgi:hypothetical protein
LNTMQLNVFKLNEQVTQLTADKDRLVKALEAKEADFTKLVTESAEQVQGMAKHAAEIDALKAESAKALEALKAEHVKALEALTTDAAKQVEALTAQLDAAKQAANRQAAETVASLGVSADAIPATISQELTAEQINSKFAELNGKEKTEFYQKHRATILRSQGL